ncbi:glycoside hydrolase family 17 protein [Xylariaceae sp. FL1019]|nr:glycoside hydrolase family 17 protein [Xylariaceae sp. FL1019]
MKGTFAVAALAAGVNAGSIHLRHGHQQAHQALQKKGYEAESTCGCTTVYSTWTGSPTLIYPTSTPVPATMSSSYAASSSLSPSSLSSPSSLPSSSPSSSYAVVPTPVPHSYSTTGTYVIPGTTITLTSETTVPVPSSTSYSPGTYTVGGVTTVVETSTTVVCPYATVSTSGTVTTSVIETTSYVCPTPGTYTIAPTTTTVTSPGYVTVPVVTSYPAGTYTATETTVTVVDTSTVVYCPFSSSSSALPTTQPAETSTYVAVSPTASTTSKASSTHSVETSTYVAVPPPATTTSKSVEQPTSTKETSYPTSTGHSSGPGQGTAGKPWAVTYTPYGTGPEGGCKSESQIKSDLAAIAAAGIDQIRVYSTDCNTMEYVGSACESYGINLILGIYIDAPGCTADSPSVSEQVSAIKAWGKWELVNMIVVGNEAIQDGYCTPSELASLISTTKSQLGYDGPYTTAETVNIWEQEEFTSAICPVVDFVGANAHAFFNTETTASEAGQFVKGQLDIIEKVCSGKEGRIMETGWPSAGNALGLAVPGVAEQEEAIKSIVKAVGDKAVLFSLTSDGWKSADTACACEPHWGCAQVLGIQLS